MEYAATKLGRMRIKAAALQAVSDLTSALIDAYTEEVNPRTKAA